MEKILKTYLFICILFLFSGCFKSDEKLIMKCADIKYEKSLGIYQEGRKTTLELLYYSNLDERFDHSDFYIKLYRNCEFQFNNSPKTFKQLYK